jgi:hypothetical protein
MSLWLYKRDKSGKKFLWQIDFEPLSVIMVLGFLIALIGPSIFRNPTILIYFPYALVTIGLACLIISKVSLYKKGIWFSFGPALMSKGYAKLYKIAYVLMGLGTLILLLLFNALQKA